MNLGINRVIQLSSLVVLLASVSLQHKMLKIAAAAALLRGGPIIPLPIRYKVPQQTKIVHYPVRVPVHIPVHHHTQQVKVVHVPVHHHTHSEQHHHPVHHHHVEVSHPQQYYHHYQPGYHMGHIAHRDDVYGGHHGGYAMGHTGNDGSYGYGGEIHYAY